MSSSTAKQKQQYTKRKDLAPLQIPAIPIRTSQPSDDNYCLPSSSSSMSYSPANSAEFGAWHRTKISNVSCFNYITWNKPACSILLPAASYISSVRTLSEQVDKVLVVIGRIPWATFSYAKSPYFSLCSQSPTWTVISTINKTDFPFPVAVQHSKSLTLLPQWEFYHCWLKLALDGNVD